MTQLTGDDDPRWLTDLFTPLILKAGGPWTAAALADPRPLLMHNLAKSFDIKPLRTTGNRDRVRIETRHLGDDAVIRWLTP